jgi:serine/threonine-protein kinase
MDVLLAHATEPPPAFADVGAPEWIPQAVEEVVRACLAKDRDDRPASARELAGRYQQALEAVPPSKQEIVAEDSATAPAADGDEPETGAAAAKYGADPNAVVFHLEAWMPEVIAAHKLCGFFQDVGAAVIDSVPGLIRVRVGHPGTVYHHKSGALAWIGLGKSGLIELELHMEQSDANRKGMLDIAVLMRSLNGDAPTNPHWLARCKRIFVDLRAYLMGQEGGSRF